MPPSGSTKQARFRGSIAIWGCGWATSLFICSAILQLHARSRGSSHSRWRQSTCALGARSGSSRRVPAAVIASGVNSSLALRCQSADLIPNREVIVYGLNMTRSTETQELLLERIFDAPRHLVYRAFTDPDHIARWFGPVGWSVPRDTIDVDARVGGHQRLVMVNNEDPSQTAPLDATFTEVIENELLVGSQEAPPQFGLPPGTMMNLRLEFHELDGRTRLILHQGPFL